MRNGKPGKHVEIMGKKHILMVQTEYLGTYIWYKEHTNVGEYVLDNM
jgi:hypothetical protein